VNEQLTFEQALGLFDKKLRELEDGDLALDQALKAVEEMSVYLRVCEARLEDAKQKIEVRADGGADPEAAAGSK
jgi:exodeoxyribonuclease VII small subunit